MAARRNPLTLWFDTAAAMNAAAVTIAMRTIKIQQAMLMGDITGGAEARRMVTEKTIAAQQGYWRGITAITAILLSPPARTPSILSASERVASASLRPGYQKARANARRLTGLR